MRRGVGRGVGRCWGVANFGFRGSGAEADHIATADLAAYRSRKGFHCTVSYNKMYDN
jgi:hypothetical protein